MPTHTNDTFIREANGEHLLMAAIFGGPQRKLEIDRELDRRARQRDGAQRPWRGPDRAAA